MFLRLTFGTSGCRLNLCPRLPQRLKPITGFELMALERDQSWSLTALNPKVDRFTGLFGGYSC
jgi:hypothetical protein